MKCDQNTQELVLALRTKHGLTQAEIADRIGTNQVRISRWERAGEGKKYDCVLRLKALFDRLERRKK